MRWNIPGVSLFNPMIEQFLQKYKGGVRKSNFVDIPTDCPAGKRERMDGRRKCLRRLQVILRIQHFLSQMAVGCAGLSERGRSVWIMYVRKSAERIVGMR